MNMRGDVLFTITFYNASGKLERQLWAKLGIELGLLNSTTLKTHDLKQTVRRTVLVNVVEKGVS